METGQGNNRIYELIPICSGSTIIPEGKVIDTSGLVRSEQDYSSKNTKPCVIDPGSIGDDGQVLNLPNLKPRGQK